MLGRNRRISEELLYLARRRIYSNRRTVRASLPPTADEPAPGLSLHDSWCLPVIKSVAGQEILAREAPARAPLAAEPAGQSKRQLR
jgi:hypothetical protein